MTAFVDSSGFFIVIRQEILQLSISYEWLTISSMTIRGAKIQSIGIAKNICQFKKESITENLIPYYLNFNKSKKKQDLVDQFKMKTQE